MASSVAAVVHGTTSLAGGRLLLALLQPDLAGVLSNSTRAALTRSSSAITQALLACFVRFLIGAMGAGFLSKLWSSSESSSAHRGKGGDTSRTARSRTRLRIEGAGALVIKEVLGNLAFSAGLDELTAPGIDALVPLLAVCYAVSSRRPQVALGALVMALAGILSLAWIGQRVTSIPFQGIALRVTSALVGTWGMAAIAKDLSSHGGREVRIEDISSTMYDVSILAVVPAFAVLALSGGLSDTSSGISLPPWRAYAIYGFLAFVGDFSLAALAVNVSVAHAGILVSLISTFALIGAHRSATFIYCLPSLVALLLAFALLQDGTRTAPGPPIHLDEKSPPSSPRPVQSGFRKYLISRRIPWNLIVALPVMYLYCLFLTSGSKSLTWNQARTVSSRLSYKGATASRGKAETFADFLEERFPLRKEQPNIWLTLGGDGWESTLAGQQLFVDELNVARSIADPTTRPTEIVVLCMTEDCIKYCSKKSIYAYGGYEWTIPRLVLLYTWPKLQGFIDILSTGRDVFFFDADVFFKSDPYPYMPVDDFDLIISDNIRFAHGNTGWTFTRSKPATIALYHEVLKQNMESVSRDQLRTNEVLDSTFARQVVRDSSEIVRNDFVSSNPDFPATWGIRVHVLDVDRFTAFHYLFDAASSFRHEGVFLHMTCGDDGPLRREYLARTQGYGNDLNGYYSDPPKVLQIEDVAGGSYEMLTKMRILLAAAYYSGRAAMPPVTGIMTNLYDPHMDTDPPERDYQRYTYSLFPLSDIATALNVTIVEPDYVDHATERILRKSNVHRMHQVDLVRELQQTHDLDMRAVTSFGDLVRTLRSPSFRHLRVINLSNVHWSTHFLLWEMPKIMENVEMCFNIRQPPACSEICRDWPEWEAKKITGSWDDLRDVMIM